MPYEETEPAPSGGRSPLAIALITVLVLLLGLGGAVFGIYAANKQRTFAGPTPPPSTVATNPTAPDSPEPSASDPAGTPSETPGPTPTQTLTGVALPDLTGLDFQAARAKVRELKLGWRLIFEGTDAPNQTVRTTDPAPGTLAARGATVKIYVFGVAPAATVPGVVGLSCAQAAALVIDHGLYPKYLTGRAGAVTAQLPAATDEQTSHWNDEVALTCA